MKLNVINQNVVRKIDSQGRVIIPKGLRDMLEWTIGDEINFYLISENDSPAYIAMKNENTIDPKYQVAASVLEELGIEAPPQLLKKINGDK